MVKKQFHRKIFIYFIEININYLKYENYKISKFESLKF